jgi:hypothetical protein
MNGAHKISPVRTPSQTQLVLNDDLEDHQHDRAQELGQPVDRKETGKVCTARPMPVTATSMIGNRPPVPPIGFATP